MTRQASAKRPTIYDIASRAGASPAAVSMVLNGSWERHRISVEMARRVEQTAQLLGYRVNKQAQGLRLSRSGLAGMLIPHHRNRFFAGLAECFEAAARSMGLCPVVVSTQRDDEIEARFVRTLLDQRVEFLFLAGIQEPLPLNLACREAGVPCINLDLPGSEAPSVVTDNRGGARALTEVLIKQAGSAAAGQLLFLGGIAGEFATEERVHGFLDGLSALGQTSLACRILRCGYHPHAAKAALEAEITRPGLAPSGIFVNSITAFEGLLLFRSNAPDLLPLETPIGCFDWDPFAAHVPGNVTMMRQDVDAIIAAALVLLKEQGERPARQIVIPATFAGTFEEYPGS